jgi:hypothetical protein
MALGAMARWVSMTFGPPRASEGLLNPLKKNEYSDIDPKVFPLAPAEAVPMLLKEGEFSAQSAGSAAM